MDGPILWCSDRELFPHAQPGSRANALFTAAADLDDDDLDEVALYVHFAKDATVAKKTLEPTPYASRSSRLIEDFATNLPSFAIFLAGIVSYRVNLQAALFAVWRQKPERRTYVWMN